MRFFTRIVLIAFVAVSIYSCSKFDKLVKSSDFELKYTKALEYYNHGNYSNAMTLLEELIPVYKGTERAEEVYYYYSYCNYNQGDYGLAAYHFKTYARTWPFSKHAEECAYLNAYCYYLNSPKYSLDQSDTKNAIQEMQAFLDTYPESKRVDSCNLIIDELRVKLEKKAYANAKQYYYLEDWKAAITECSNFIKDFQDSKSLDEMHYMVVRSYYLLALNSTDTKKQERLDKAIENYLKFVDLYPQSKYLREMESIYGSCQKLKNQLNQ